MTIGSHELALTIVNNGQGYGNRCAISRAVLARNTYGQVSYAAHRWLNVAQAGAAAYERQFGSPGASCFTVEDILLAAVELAEYYDRHVAECETDVDALRRSSSNNVKMWREGDPIVSENQIPPTR